MGKVRFKGIMPAMLAPFKRNLQLDIEGIKTNAKFFADAGCTGIVCNGSTGEAVNLSAEERVAVINATREAVGRKLIIIAGTGAPTTGAAVESTTDAVDYSFRPFFRFQRFPKLDRAQVDYFFPFGLYRRVFSTPETWRGKQVFLTFEGVCSAFYAWVNVEETGLSAEQLSSLLLEEAGVAAIAGGAFGAEGKSYLRFSLVSARRLLEEALERIERVSAHWRAPAVR